MAEPDAWITFRQIAAGNEWDQLSDCLPAGYPRWYTEPFLREFIVTPDETWWINEQQSETRRIYTDGRTMPADLDPTNTGTSIGRWEGETLVVETRGINPLAPNAANTLIAVQYVPTGGGH